MNTSNTWQDGDNLLKPASTASAPKPSAPAVAKEFEQIREVNLAYISRLPSFIADEVAVQMRKPKGSDKWKDKDIFESEISFKGQNATRQNIRINGKRWSSPSRWLPGPNWGIGFGDDLKPLFDRGCENEITFEGRKEMAGEQLLAFRFRVPMDGCLGSGVYGYQYYSGAQKGQILVNQAGNVIQMERTDVGIPTDLGLGSTTVLRWGKVKIGDATHLLPIAEDWTFYSANGDTWHVTVTFQNHRHFEAATSIQFQ